MALETGEQENPCLPSSLISHRSVHYLGRTLTEVRHCHPSDDAGHAPTSSNSCRTGAAASTWLGGCAPDSNPTPSCQQRAHTSCASNDERSVLVTGILRLRQTPTSACAGRVHGGCARPHQKAGAPVGSAQPPPPAPLHRLLRLAWLLALPAWLPGRLLRRGALPLSSSTSTRLVGWRGSWVLGSPLKQFSPSSL